MTATAEHTVVCELPVFFATTDGQTRRIAERLATIFRERGFESRAIDVDGPEAGIVDWSRVRGAVLGASLRKGNHQQAATAFVRAHAAQLHNRPSAFFSVSLSAASAAAAERAAATQLAYAFPTHLQWYPELVVCLAGRLAYTRYGFLTRFVMKRIARKEGAPTDVTRDYELTNWSAVERLADDIAGLIASAERNALAPSAAKPRSSVETRMQIRASVAGPRSHPTPQACGVGAPGCEDSYGRWPPAP